MKAGERKVDGRWQAIVFDADTQLVYECDHRHVTWTGAAICGKDWITEQGQAAPVQGEGHG